MIEDISPRPERVEMNKTSLYLYLTRRRESRLFTLTVTPPPSPPPSTTPTPTSLPTTATPPPSTATSTQPHAPGTEFLIAAALIVVAAITATLLLRKRGRGDCADLNETDQAIIKALIDRGGVAERAELQEALGFPKTTLHRHLHKLAKYGYIKLEQLGNRQRVKLLRKC